MTNYAQYVPNTDHYDTIRGLPSSYPYERREQLVPARRQNYGTDQQVSVPFGVPYIQQHQRLDYEPVEYRLNKTLYKPVVKKRIEIKYIPLFGVRKIKSERRREGKASRNQKTVLICCFRSPGVES